MGLEQLFDGLAGWSQRRVAQFVLAVQRGETGGAEQAIALAQGNLQLLGEMQQHLAAGLGASGFDEAQVAGGYLCLAGEVELAQAAPLAPLAPLAQQGAGGLGIVHGQHDSSVRSCRPLPGR